jgi:Zn finger protein HypA/HybF involved in hydrogenase expression
MLDRQHNQFSYECDACDDTLETGEAEFSDALARFRCEGWKAEKIGEEWTHLCPTCRGRP